MVSDAAEISLKRSECISESPGAEKRMPAMPLSAGLWISNGKKAI